MRQASRGVNTGGGQGATTYLVEHYWPGITAEVPMADGRPVARHGERGHADALPGGAEKRFGSTKENR